VPLSLDRPNILPLIWSTMMAVLCLVEEHSIPPNWLFPPLSLWFRTIMSSQICRNLLVILHTILKILGSSNLGSINNILNKRPLQVPANSHNVFTPFTPDLTDSEWVLSFYFWDLKFFMYLTDPQYRPKLNRKSQWTKSALTPGTVIWSPSL